MFSRFSVNASVCAAWGLIITALFVSVPGLIPAAVICLIASYAVGIIAHGAETQSFLAEKWRLENQLKNQAQAFDMLAIKLKNEIMDTHTNSNMAQAQALERVLKTEARASELVATLKAAMTSASGGREPW